MGAADDYEFLADEAFGFAPKATVARRIGRVAVFDTMPSKRSAHACLRISSPSHNFVTTTQTLSSLRQFWQMKFKYLGMVYCISMKQFSMLLDLSAAYRQVTSMVKRTALELARALERYSRMKPHEARETLADEWPREIAALVDPILSGEPLLIREKGKGFVSISDALSVSDRSEA
jgi:hypothetical protein